jgi:uncharacterized protein YaiE (UPF0345 family)
LEACISFTRRVNCILLHRSGIRVHPPCSRPSRQVCVHPWLNCGFSFIFNGRSAVCVVNGAENRHLRRMKHNSYFEGKVQSLAVSTPDGPATVGVIEPGKYSFGTDCEEHMHIVSGTLKAKLPNGDWKSYGKGQFFVVPPKVKFEVEAVADVAYLCFYKR